MLARLNDRMRRDDEGFTLIELLVVIIIIGILAAIAIPVFLNQRKKGYDASIKSDLNTVANEEQTYFVDNAMYTSVSQAGNVVTIGTDTQQVSNGTTITALGSSGMTVSFCLRGTNTHDSATTYYYDSLNGGLQPPGTTCTAGS